MSLGRSRRRGSYPVGSIHWRPTPKPVENRAWEWIKHMISRLLKRTP